MKVFLYLATVLVIAAAISIMMLGNVFIGLLVAGLYGLAMIAYALVVVGDADEWKW